MSVLENHQNGLLPRFGLELAKQGIQQCLSHGAAAAIGQKGRYVPVVESVVDLGKTTDQNKKPNDFWSEWQDSNLRPLRPERSALPG